MEKIVIVGSGASGAHFALSVLHKGYQVTMLDVGCVKPDYVNPDDNFRELKINLSDPVQYFLGQHYEAVVYPDATREYYGFPPNKHYIFAQPDTFTLEKNGFEPLFSFAQGGLAETWTGGVYALNDHDLIPFPFSYGDIAPYYDEAARRIGMTGVHDDLSQFIPWHHHIMEPLGLDPHSQQLLHTYHLHRRALRDELNCYLGRSRIATLSKSQEERQGCTYCGRCLWGCPTEALYTPRITLNQCFQHENFSYIPNMYVSHFTYNSTYRIQSMMAQSLTEGRCYEFSGNMFVLAAGTLSSSKIFLDSIRKATGKTLRLPGLMDNRQILLPFINLNMLGKTSHSESYQYHQLAMGIETERPEAYIHGQITTLKSALVHPIIHQMPFDLRTSIPLFKNVRAALGVINVNLHDWRRETNYVTVKDDHASGKSKLMLTYVPDVSETARIKQTVKTVKRVLRRLGCIVPPGMTHVRPMGASVHYAGTIPMSTYPAPLTASTYGQSHDFENLYMVDGSTFPFLPAKNLTFTLMANAIRVAAHAF